MNTENIFTLGLMIVIIVLIITTGVYQHKKNILKIQAITCGADPLEVAVAMGEDFNGSDIAVILASKEVSNERR